MYFYNKEEGGLKSTVGRFCEGDMRGGLEGSQGKREIKGCYTSKRQLHGKVGKQVFIA